MGAENSLIVKLKVILFRPLGVAIDLLQSGNSLKHFVDSVDVKRFHALTNGDFADLNRGLALKNHLSNLGVDHHQLKNTQSPPIPALAAVSAALSFHEVG